MKKALLFVASVAVLAALSSCGSLRTPTSGPRNGNTYYNTFFGLSLESGVYGDGFLVNQGMDQK